MQLKKLQQQFELFKGYLKKPKSYDRLYVWEAQRNFQEHWNIQAVDLEEMYDRSLTCSQTKRLWKRQAYEPKKMMRAFIQMQADFVQHMFKDLFNEEKEVDARMDRFIFYCDQMLQQFKNLYPSSIENNHYHEDNYQMVSLYLSFRYPLKYTLYRATSFKRTLELVGSMDIPKVNDLSRFFKVTNTIYKLMNRDEQLMQLHRDRLLSNKHYMEDSLLLVYDFYEFCTQSVPVHR